jgi:ubiquinone/menaquinone biosynthesis C-methylase UbiE
MNQAMNCDWIAPYYRWFEYLGFGGELERRRYRFLAQARPAHRVLVLGDGDGRFLARLAEEIPGAEIDSIEASERMRELARSRSGRCSDHARVNHLLGDARQFPLAAGRYDLVATHFFLDCFDARECPQVIERIATAAAPRARWLISEFRQAPNGWRGLWSRAWIGSLYGFFRVVTGLRTRALVDHHPILARCGFRLVCQETSRFGLLASELWIKVEALVFTGTSETA